VSGAPDTGNRKRSVSIRGHRTSFTLEELFWRCLAAMAAERSMPVAALVAEIDTSGQGAGSQDVGNLSSRIRLRVLDWSLDGGRLPDTLLATAKPESR